MKIQTFTNNGFVWLMLLAVGTVFVVSSTEAATSRYSPYYSALPLDGQNPEYILRTLARLRQAIIAEEDLEKICGPVQKRHIKSIDFGMGRGHSGALEAQYRMAIESAFSPHGPGRKKRDFADVLQQPHDPLEKSLCTLYYWATQNQNDA